MSCGCNEIAGLQEHQVYPGFPDSASDVRCSTGSERLMDNSVVPGVFVSCDGTADKPQDGTLYYGRPSYTREGNNVRDSITGLVWHAQSLTATNQKDADGQCKELGSDFRLPSRLELASLLDYGANGAFIASNIFQGIMETPYYTSTDYPNTDPQYDNTHWAVFLGAATPEVATHQAGEILGMSDTTDAGILCVKGDSGPYQVGPFVAVNNTQTLLADTRTGLVWMASSFITTSWRDALSQCANKIVGDYSDFRLPNAKELATLIDDSVPEINPDRVHAKFNLQGDPYLWSSTPSPDPTKAFALSTSGASIQPWPSEINYYDALCVRGPD